MAEQQTPEAALEGFKRAKARRAALAADAASLEAQIKAAEQDLGRAVMAGDDGRAETKALAAAKARLEATRLAIAEADRAVEDAQRAEVDATRASDELALAAVLRRAADAYESQIVAAIEQLVAATLALSDYELRPARGNSPENETAAWREMRDFKRSPTGVLAEIMRHHIVAVFDAARTGRPHRLGLEIAPIASRWRERASHLDGTHFEPPRRAIVKDDVLVVALRPLSYRQQGGVDIHLDAAQLRRVPAVVADRAVALGAGKILKSGTISLSGIRAANVMRGDRSYSIVEGQRVAWPADVADELVATGAARVTSEIHLNEAAALAAELRSLPIDRTKMAFEDLGRVDDLIDGTAVDAPNLMSVGGAAERFRAA